MQLMMESQDYYTDSSFFGGTSGTRERDLATFLPTSLKDREPALCVSLSNSKHY